MLGKAGLQSGHESIVNQTEWKLIDPVGHMHYHTAFLVHPRLVFQQLSSASLSTEKAAYGGTSSVFYFL